MEGDLERLNRPGLAALRRYLESGDAVAFLGAGASAPLYPLWNGLISELVDEASDRLSSKEMATCRALASSSPDAVVEIVRRSLGVPRFREVLRQVLRARSDPVTGRSWTDVHELVCRCPFQAVVTTNYDPGIVNARMRVRLGAAATGFMTWEDELGLDRWRTGDVFGEDELPVLFAHGQHNRPDSIVLATTEYRRAYAGKLPHVLARLMDGHLCWIGFSFADQRIASILREIGERTGTSTDPGGPPRHVAIMPWDPAADGNEPEILVQRAEIEYGAQAILYPAPGGDHSALATLLNRLTDARFPAAVDVPDRPAQVSAGPGPQAEKTQTDLAVRWEPPPDPVAHFTGRTEELARLNRWAADPQVRLMGVSAWGGAGKTALVTRWVRNAQEIQRRAGLKGVFGWSFYTDPSPDNWARELLAWAHEELGIDVRSDGRTAVRVLEMMETVPTLLVLDGLEVVQEGPAGNDFGRLLDGLLREVLTSACQLPHGLVLLTSRFPFADLEGFDGGPARMLELLPFTPDEGATLLAAGGGGWLPEPQRKDLVAAVDGHALAITVLAGLLARRPSASSLDALYADLSTAARTDASVGKVLTFYASRLAESDRYLLAAMSLFTRPVGADAVLTVAAHEAFRGRLTGWTAGMVQAATRERLTGMVTWHPDATISAHPLVRDTFRPLALTAATIAADTSLTGIPEGTVTTRAEALRVTEAIELLLDADQWRLAEDLYRARLDSGDVWKHLPAARLGQRTATAFVATPARSDACAANLSRRGLAFYLNDVGLFAKNAGDLVTGRQNLAQAAQLYREVGDMHAVALVLGNLADCLGRLGQLEQARDVIDEAITFETTSDAQHLYACKGWLAGLAGDTWSADHYFTSADRVRLSDGGGHLVSFSGTKWAQWLGRTGREDVSQKLTRPNADISRANGWNDDTARCNQILGDLALAAGDTETAGQNLAAAVAAFRDGDYLVELAEALPSLAVCSQASGDLEAAERYLAEAITIAAPRALIPAHATTLAARARLRAAQASVGEPDAPAQGRDDADAARRLAVRHYLPWNELDALTSHALLDEAEGISHGWADQARRLRSRLVPPDLDADPLATAERLVAKERAGQKNVGES
jgi:tetratricopeptide (TPR) repeat protein